MGGFFAMHYSGDPRSGSSGIQGEVLGYNVSFRFLGNVLGPLLGGIISSHFTISATFYVTAFLFFAGACMLWIMQKLRKDSYAKAS